MHAIMCYDEKSGAEPTLHHGDNDRKGRVGDAQSPEKDTANVQ
jgi:hypothetical protein